MWDLGGLNVLIPKRRGTGYLRVPYGHHNDPKLNRIADAIRADVCGLDGYLAFEISLSRQDRERIVGIVLPMLAAHFGFTQWREDPKAFWAELLPNNGDHADRSK